MSTTTKIPVKCQRCKVMNYVPEYCFIDGFWYGDIRKQLRFCCKNCGWKELIII